MSRKRDTNWNRDEIAVLLDSIMEITKMRAEDGKRTNSREVFEFAAKRLGDKGHTSRAEREKCRTKWKKMKEEFTHAKKAREGDERYKEAPGIQPFYDRMEEFINGNFDNISPHSTIVRRCSSISSSNNTISTNATSSSSSSSASTRTSSVSRSSARLAANNPAVMVVNSIGAVVEPDDLSSPTTNNTSAPASVGSQDQHKPLSVTPSNPSHSANSSQPSSRISSVSDSNTNIINNSSNNNNSGNILFPSSTVTHNNSNTVNDARGITNLSTNQHNGQQQAQQQHHQHLQSQQHQQQRQAKNYSVTPIHQTQHLNAQHHAAIANGDTAPTNPTYNNHNNLVYNPQTTNNMLAGHQLNDSNHHHQQTPITAAEHADISYRVGSGCRQITIFGDHDVDIKFRGDCVTINKINHDYSNCSLGGAGGGGSVAAAGYKAHSGSTSTSNNTTREMDDDCL